MSFYIVISFLLITSLAGALIVYFKLIYPLRKKEPGYDFVFVENDGTVRELNFAEVEFLERPFITDNPARPKIKRRYDEKNENGGLAGFIKRTRVPKQINIVAQNNASIFPN